MNRVIPGILENNWEEIEKKIKIVKTFAYTVHIDFIDGIFAPNKTLMDFEPFKNYTKGLNFEAHLITDNPIQYLKTLANVGFRRFLGHVEKMPNVAEFVAEGEILGEVGLALDIDTPISAITVPFDDLDVVLIMSAKAGKSGQTFSQSAILKIKELRQKTIVPIEIDCGINEESIVAARVFGANRFVTDSFIFESSDPLNSFEKLEGLVS